MSITLFKFLVTTLVTLYNWSKSNSDFSKFTNLDKPIDAKLQTAYSLEDEYSIISVQRLLDLITPRFFWLDFSFAASL